MTMTLQQQLLHERNEHADTLTMLARMAEERDGLAMAYDAARDELINGVRLMRARAERERRAYFAAGLLLGFGLLVAAVKR